MPNSSEAKGLVLWLILIVGSLIIRQVSLRVSRNPGATRSTSTQGTGPKWEQDEPYALMLDDEDDLIFPEED